MTVEAAVQEDIFIFNLCVRLLTVGLERLLERQFAEDYRWLLSLSCGPSRLGRGTVHAGR